MKAFYPKTTPEIIHKGRMGNVYRLDGIEKCIRLKELLIKNGFDVQEVESNSRDLEQSAIDLILSAHSDIFISAYKTGVPTDIANESGLMWQPKLYDFVLEEALCSKNVIDETLDNNKVIAIVGGGHHAEHDNPFGFCTINTMAISALYAASKHLKTLLIDLDSHYSNGCIDILLDKPNIFVASIWHQKLDMWKYYKSENNIWHQKVDTELEYFDALNTLIAIAKEYKPQLIIYHFGIDILETDRIGGIKGMTEKNLYKREHMIKQLVDQTNSKLAIFIGGAYIDRTKGEEYEEYQKGKTTEIQCKVLQTY